MKSHAKTITYIELTSHKIKKRLCDHKYNTKEITVL